MPAQRRPRRPMPRRLQRHEGPVKACPRCGNYPSGNYSCHDHGQSSEQRRESISHRRTISSSFNAFILDASRPLPFDHSAILKPGTLVTSRPTESKKGREELSVGDQQMLENWLASTEQTLTARKHGEYSWQLVIRENLGRNKALLHGVLALSAMHFAHSSKPGSAQRNEYLLDAKRHYCESIAALSSPMPWGFSDTGAFSVSGVLFMCGLTSINLGHKEQLRSYFQASRNGTSLSVCFQKLLDIFMLIHRLPFSPGLIDIAEEGELKALFTYNGFQQQLPSTYKLTIFSIRRFHTNVAEHCPAHGSLVYDDAITKLDRSLEMLCKGAEPMIIALKWVLSIDCGFLDLVRQRQPLALIIFAHYCAILHQLRDRWWIGRLGRRLLEEISDLLGEKRVYISWATDAVGLN